MTYLDDDSDDDDDDDDVEKDSDLTSTMRAQVALQSYDDGDDDNDDYDKQNDEQEKHDASEKYHSQDPSLPVQYVGNLVDLCHQIIVRKWINLGLHICCQVRVSAATIHTQLNHRLLIKVIKVPFQFSANS